MLRPLALATLLALACRGASPPPAPAPVPAAPDPPLRGDDEWALAVRESADPSARVCVVEADEEPCRGRTGGILRLSRAYADRGGSAARVFVVYTPMRDESGTFVRAP